jgi:hypothetical protein
MPSRWCAWCGKPVAVGLIVGGAVRFHEFCSWQRARILGNIQAMLIVSKKYGIGRRTLLRELKVTCHLCGETINVAGPPRYIYPAHKEKGGTRTCQASHLNVPADLWTRAFLDQQRKDRS